MNTKFSFTLLAVLILLLVSLAVTTSFSKAPESTAFGQSVGPVLIPARGGNDLSDFYQRHSELSPANDLSDYYQRHSELIPANDLSDYHQRHSDLSSAAEGAREAQAPRLWSGEVFLSDNHAPDTNMVANQDLQSICMSEDSLIRRHGGCVE